MEREPSRAERGVGSGIYFNFLPTKAAVSVRKPQPMFFLRICQVREKCEVALLTPLCSECTVHDRTVPVNRAGERSRLCSKIASALGL